jgi:hypothetical protein
LKDSTYSNRLLFRKVRGLCRGHRSFGGWGDIDKIDCWDFNYEHYIESGLLELA